MEIKLLPTEINERFRSNINVNNISQCILELIFNSLDAKATTIAVRINIPKHEVQIIDNGVGISLDDLQNIGIRYMTSKFESLHSFYNKHKYYGYKGESLASIICISKGFSITTRYYKDTSTYCKTFENGSFISIVPASERSSKGTTTTVNGFLFNCPVKQKRIKYNLELNNIKTMLKSLTIIHPKVSFSLRDNTTGKILLDCYKTQTVSKSLCALYEGIASEDLLTVKVSKNNIAVSGLIYTKTYQNCKPQLVYVNKRPVNNEIIEKHVKDMLENTLNTATADSNSVFVINIRCPYTEVNFSYRSSNVSVEFKSWHVVLKCIEKMISLFIKKYKKFFSQKEDSQNNEDVIVHINSEQNVNDKPETKYETANIPNKENKETGKIASCNALNNLRKYKKSLGLKKSKLKLRKKKYNIFEETNESLGLSLTLKEILSNKPLKRNIKQEATCLKSIFEDQFNSQHLMLEEKLYLPKSVSQGLHATNNEANGKEFIMDLFLNSLTPSLRESGRSKEKIPEKINAQKDNLVQIAPIIEEVLIDNTNAYNILESRPTDNNENSHELVKKRGKEELNKIGSSLVKDQLFKKKNVNSDTSSVSNIPELCTSNNNENPSQIIIDMSVDNEPAKKRKLEKLNKIGTSLRTNKLFKKIKNVNFETASVSSISKSRISNNNENPLQTIDVSFDNELVKQRRVEKLNKVGISLRKNKLFHVNANSKFRRIKSEDKSVQTNFPLEDKFDRVSVGIQSSQDKEDHSDRVLGQNFQVQTRLSQNGQIHEEVDQNSLFTEAHIRRASQNITINNKDRYYNLQRKNIIRNEATFVSHCHPKHVVDVFSKTHNTTVEISTRKIMEDFNKTLSPGIPEMDADENYNIFKENLENIKTNLLVEDNCNFTLTFLNTNNEKDANTSRFFNGGEANKRIPRPKLNSNRGTPEKSFSILINTSRFLQEHVGNGPILMGRSDEFDVPDYERTFHEEFQSESVATFNQFLPAHKSTQKDPKYRGRVDNNFFESFVFNECNWNLHEENQTPLDITFPLDFQQNRCNNETMPKGEWSQKFDSVGNHFYVNKRTGMTTYNILNKESKFFMKKRVDFVPKGLSPILKKVDSIDVSLSPTSRKQLNNAIIESYENELDLIKWQEYIDKEDPEAFFHRLYEEKRKQMEQIIPSIEDVCLRNVKKVYSPNEPFTFTKDVFAKLEVLGQMDNKFIVALSNHALVILLDQHAVHERIMVENLLHDYVIENTNQIIFKSTDCKKTFTINYASTELQLLSSFKSQFKNLGLVFEVYSTYIKVIKIPLCFSRKCSNNTRPEETLHKFVSTLVNDELMIIRATRGILSNIPKIIQYVINNEACRGAIKFGRKLTRSECIQYVRDLSKCQLPFQCAHGRPTLFPVLEMSDSNENCVSYNLKALK